MRDGQKKKKARQEGNREKGMKEKKEREKQKKKLQSKKENVRNLVRKKKRKINEYTIL